MKVVCEVLGRRGKSKQNKLGHIYFFSECCMVLIQTTGETVESAGLENCTTKCSKWVSL